MKANAYNLNSLIRRLKTWRNRRTKIAARPERKGKPLQNDELTEAIKYLGEFRELLMGAKRVGPEPGPVESIRTEPEPAWAPIFRAEVADKNVPRCPHCGGIATP